MASRENGVQGEKHRFLTRAGYRIIRRYENNGWYVPADSAVKGRLAPPLGDPAQILPGATLPHGAQSFAAVAGDGGGRQQEVMHLGRRAQVSAQRSPLTRPASATAA